MPHGGIDCVEKAALKRLRRKNDQAHLVVKIHKMGKDRPDICTAQPRMYNQLILPNRLTKWQ